MRPIEERERLLEICQVCPKYEDKPAMLGLSGGRCGVCKCGLVVERDILNKLAWATEDCPLGYWAKIVSPSCPDYSPSKRDDDPDGGQAG